MNPQMFVPAIFVLLKINVALEDSIFLLNF